MLLLLQESLTLAEAEQCIPSAPDIPISVSSCSSVRGEWVSVLKEADCRTAAKHQRRGQWQELRPCDALALTSAIPAGFCINKVKLSVCMWVGCGGHMSPDMQNKNVSERDGGSHLPINHYGLIIPVSPSICRRPRRDCFARPPLFLSFSLVLNYRAALLVFIYLSKVHVQYACTDSLLGERGAAQRSVAANHTGSREGGGERKRRGGEERLEV